MAASTWWAVDLFAGPGGIDEGLRAVAPELHALNIGVELDTSATATARRAGHVRTAPPHTDVYTTRPSAIAVPGSVKLLSGSPPCGGVSSSGLQEGREDFQDVMDLVECLAGGDDRRADYLFRWRDLRSPLMAEPMRWIVELQPRSVLLEQVPAVLPIWEDYAAHLQEFGYSVDVGVLNARRFGVPQDRERAILAASLDRPVVLPHGVDEDVPAASVLGPGVVGFARRNDRDDGLAYRARDWRSTELPAFTVTEKARSWTLMHEGKRRQLTPGEAGQLQGFPADYPWPAERRDRSVAFLQVANAVPPPLAAAVLEQIL